MIKNKLLYLILFLCITVLAHGQNGNLHGNILDSDGQPLIGANVIIKGTTTGTITDISGNYTLQSVPVGTQILVASFIGYLPEELTITIVANETSTANFKLFEDITTLDELIVIGYGVVKKEDKTGAVSTVTSADFTRGAITSAQELVTGKISGVQITSGGGAPGSESTIRIRGGSSINGSNDPLIIIDGIPIDNQSVSGMRNPLNTINPNDIETFTVLKDASATAIYGSRASNGVIIITTKSGSDGKVKIDYQGSVSINTVTKTVETLTANSYRATVNDAYPLLTSYMGQANTNWMDEIFNTTISNSHNLSLNGTFNKMLPYRFSVGYDNNNGILKTTQLDRITTSLNLNPSFFNDLLKVKVSAKYMNVKNQFADEGAIGSAMTMDPTQTPYSSTLYQEFGGYYTWVDQAGLPIPIAPKNPLAQLEQKTNKATVNRFIGNAQIDYRLHFLRELRLNLNVGTDFSSSDGTEDKDALAAWDLDAYNRGGDIHNYAQEKKNDILEYYMEYDNELPGINSKFKILGGYSWQHFWRQEENHTYYKLANDEGEIDRSPFEILKTENYLVSFFGRLNYTFYEKYLFTATVRYDGSSRFPKQNKWGIFPSAALAWNLHKEMFIKNITAISELKLRLGYGITGQQEVGNDYPSFGTYTAGEPTAAYIYRNPTNGNYDRIETLTYRPNSYDANLKWEETTTYNIGIDYGFLQDRISGSLEAYSRYTTDLLNEIPVAAGTNFSNRILTNVGNTTNQGIELSISGTLISKSDLVWKLGVNGSYNHREITKLTAVDDPDYIGVEVGGIEGGTGNNIQIHQVGQTPSSFYVYEQLYDANGKPLEGEYVDITSDGVVNEKDKRAYKSSSPSFIYGLSSNLTYKNWDLSIAGHGSLGNYVYNNVASNTAYTDRLQTNGQFLSNITADIYNTNFQSSQFFSDYYVQKASFFRLDNISLGYNFEPSKLKGIEARIFASVNNVFVITPYQGIDPEVFDGIDNNNYPRPRIFLLGVNLSF